MTHASATHTGRSGETRSAPAQPESGVAISLHLHEGDAWAWEKLITGSCPGLDPAAAIDLIVNGEPIVATRDGDAFGATVRLRPGRNTVKGVATGGSHVESAEVVHTVRLAPRPTARIAVESPNGLLILDATASEPSDFDDAPITRYAWATGALTPGTMYTALQEDGHGQRVVTVPAPDVDGEYTISLTITDREGRHDTSTVMVVAEGGEARVVNPVREQAAWIDGACVYGVVVRNVGPEGFQGVTARLDDLADLGISALWLAPINVTTPGDFGYGVVDYFDVRPEYGTLDDFKRLVQEAHARNIRVLMDVVPNHTASEHPYCRDAERHGLASPYHDFYDRDPAGAATHYFNWTHLPNLNFDNPDVRRFMTEALMFWVRECDVDGLRVDVAWGIERRRPDYWLEFSAEFHRVKPDGLLIAEASARDSYYVNHGFGAAYDWTDELGVWAWTEVFVGDLPISTAIKNVLLNGNGQSYDPATLVFRFLNNNDTGPRFVTTHGVDLYRVASAMLLTLPGLPCLFTGDEVGAEFEPYVNAGPIDWTDRHGLRAHFRKLIQLRREHPGLKSRAWTILDIEPASQIFGYVRHQADGGSPVLVLLNFSGDEIDAAIDSQALDQVFGDEHEPALLQDLYNGTEIVLATGPRRRIPIGPWGIRILANTTQALP